MSNNKFYTTYRIKINDNFELINYIVSNLNLAVCIDETDYLTVFHIREEQIKKINEFIENN